MHKPLFSVCLALFAACAPTENAGGDDLAMDPPDLAFPVASHTALPQLPNQGGPIIANPKIVTITFAGFPFDQQTKNLGDWLASSSWLSSVGAEYGIGVATHTHVQLSTPAPASLSNADIATLLAARIADQTLPASPGAASDYIYVFVVSPETATPDSADLTCATSSLQGRRAYHGITHSLLPFVVVGTCTTEDITFLDRSLVHEIFEAASDPRFDTDPAYATAYDSEWQILGNELGDFCDGDVYSVDGFTVQRIWSNAAVVAGTYPCVPAPDPATPYYNVSADRQVVSIAPGGSATVTLTGWSTGTVVPWHVIPAPENDPFVFTATVAPAVVGNGDTAQLTITVPATARRGSWSNLALYSSPHAGIYRVPYNAWAVQVKIE